MTKYNLTKTYCRLVSVVFFVMGLTACVAEPNYRGVPDPSWRELTGEQKQLVVDQSYEKEFNTDI